MGLDMYFVFTSEDNKPDINEIIAKEQYYESSENNIYWRKMFAIHCWLEAHLDRQKYPFGSIGNMEWYYFSEKTLRDLYKDCQKVLTDPDHARGIIPPSDPRPKEFAEMININDYYYECIKETVWALEKNLSNPTLEHGGWYAIWD